MKKIINGKKYDTDTAKEVGSWSNGLSYRDFGWCREQLYRKKTGEFFLFGEGGPASKYAERFQNSRIEGEEIRPLPYEAAREWAEKHLDADEYEEIFGEVVEDDSRTVATLSLSVTALETAKRAAAKSDTSLSAYIEALILAAREDA